MNYNKNYRVSDKIGFYLQQPESMTGFSVNKKIAEFIYIYEYDSPIIPKVFNYQLFGNPLIGAKNLVLFCLSNSVLLGIFHRLGSRNLDKLSLCDKLLETNKKKINTIIKINSFNMCSLLSFLSCRHNCVRSRVKGFF